MTDQTQLTHAKITGLFHNNDNMGIDTMARTIWGEARGEGARGMQAVAYVIKNRADIAMVNGGAWWGNDVVAVCRKPYQFSCWNLNDPNREKLLAVDERDAVFRQALAIANRIMKGEVCAIEDEAYVAMATDPTGGATHYHHFKQQPKWAVGHTPTCRIGNHVFYDLRMEH